MNGLWQLRSSDWIPAYTPRVACDRARLVIREG